MLNLQRSAGNAAVTALVAGEAAGPPFLPPAVRAAGEPVLQRAISRGSGWGWPFWVTGGQELWTDIQSLFNTRLFAAQVSLTQLRATYPSDRDLMKQLTAVDKMIADNDNRAITFEEAQKLHAPLKKLVARAEAAVTKAPEKEAARLRREAAERKAVLKSRKEVVQLLDRLTVLTQAVIDEENQPDQLLQARLKRLQAELEGRKETASPLSPGYMKVTVQQITGLEEAYGEAATRTEQARLEKIRLEKQRILDDQQREEESLRRFGVDTLAEAEKVQRACLKDGDVKWAKATNHQVFVAPVKALDAAVKALKLLKESGVGTREALSESLELVKTRAGEIRLQAAGRNAEEPAKITQALADLNLLMAGRGAAAGTRPRKKDLKDVVEPLGIPGRVNEVEEAYEVHHWDTAPQAALRRERLKSLEGETARWDSVATWMREAGLGGTPRTSPKGPLFIRRLGSIRAFPSHFSQYLSNAALPKDRRRTPIDKVMESLFPNAVAGKGPHITQERSPDFGAPENARYFKGGKFRPGSAPLDERGPLQAALSETMNTQIAQIQSNLETVLLPPEGDD